MMRPKPTTPFDGVAWITGASSGIGYATALRLANMGWRVAVTARSYDKLESLKAAAHNAYGEILVMPGDVTDSAAMNTLVAALERDHGGVALALLNAGIYQPLYANQLSVETFETSFGVNLGGTVKCLVPLIAAMEKRGRGQIALVSSVAGYGGLPTSAAYGASKAALINLAASLKFDLDKMGLLIQVINPGFVDTPATQSNPFAMPFLMDVEAASERLVRGLQSGRFEVTFPKRFTYLLKAINLLPYGAYFPLVNAFTGWKSRPLAEDQGKEGSGSEQDLPKSW